MFWVNAKTWVSNKTENKKNWVKEIFWVIISKSKQKFISAKIKSQKIYALEI